MIRRIKENDYSLLKELVSQVHELHCTNRPDIYLDGNPLPKEYFENILRNENNINLVYEENNIIKGLLLAEKKENNKIPIAKDRKIYFISDIVVDKEYRRQGIGKNLYNYLLELSKKEHIDAVELNVWAFNTNAIKFYSSLGMSVKNMKLEKILSTSDVEQENISINITSNVKVEGKNE